MLYGAAALVGAVLFGWLFVTLRFTPAWTYDGWMWRGAWPVLAMLAGLALVTAGVLGVLRWNHARWAHRRIRRHERPAQ